MKGFLLTIIIEDELFMIELFKIFRIGIAWINDLSGKATSLIVGLWKLETNITFAFRKELECHNFDKAGEA